jgi:cell division protein FtsZ
MPTIRFASEAEVEEALGAAAAAETKTAVLPEPVVQVPVQRPAYPVSSYYETARQQAWHEPSPRIEYAPNPEEHFEPLRPSAPEVAEEPKVVASHEPVPVPVVVDHIPEVATESRIEASRPGAEGYGDDVQGAVRDTPVVRESAPGLVPVRASVFDDDFFRRPKEEEGAKPTEDAPSKPWPDARVPSFAGYAGESTAENDELDIPAFLRRKT